LFGVGCGWGERGIAPVGITVDGSVFEDNYFGVKTWDCTRSVRVRNSEFDRGEMGVHFIQHSQPEAGFNRYLIVGNRFLQQNQYGALIFRTVELDEVSDNEFRGISRKELDQDYAVALALHSGSETLINFNNHFPWVKRARRNIFIGNDAGVRMFAN